MGVCSGSGLEGDDIWEMVRPLHHSETWSRAAHCRPAMDVKRKSPLLRQCLVSTLYKNIKNMLCVSYVFRFNDEKGRKHVWLRAWSNSRFENLKFYEFKKQQKRPRELQGSESAWPSD